MFLAGASCKKESKASTDPNDVVKAADKAKGKGSGSEKKEPLPVIDPKDIDKTPLPGLDVSKLDEKDQTLFFRYLMSFSSPCGKAHSLRTSVTTDKACRRAPFAARYLAALIEDQLPEDDIRELWESKYKDTSERQTFALAGAPHEGNEDAPIQIVEYFDYGCPACQAFKPVMDAVVEQNPNSVCVYYRMFPLTDKHPDSMSAAQAALAAHAQGKFIEMHNALFEHTDSHKRAGVMELARGIGLNMAKFQVDYDAAESQVKTEQQEGDDAGVDGTPTIFFAGRRYEGPPHPKYFGFWIQEELAVAPPKEGAAVEKAPETKETPAESPKAPNP
jgi:protein-disulfide isomerase